jgi:thiamine-phosphate diphosphorylase
MRFRPEMLTLYAITDRDCLKGRDLAEQVELALQGGATCIQLREKNMDTETLAETAKPLVEICHRYGAPLIINDNYKAALMSGADGVHVGIEDAPVAEIRRIAGADFIIGATAKTVEQALEAEKAGADYLGVGAVFPSPTKKNAIRITPAQLREIASCMGLPIAAIGGITAENVDEIKGCGYRGIAVVSAIFAEDDVKSAAAHLRRKAEEGIGL